MSELRTPEVDRCRYRITCLSTCSESITKAISQLIDQGDFLEGYLLNDLVNEMLDVARAHYADGAADGVPVDFEVVDAQEIPYADASYDAITMAYGIRNMPDRPRALSEMYRVLKPGGSLVCLEFSTPPNAVWRALYNFYLKHLIPFWGGLITGDRDGFVYLSKSIKAFPNQQGLARMMEDAGFTDVTWKNYTGGIAAVHVAKKPE